MTNSQIDCATLARFKFRIKMEADVRKFFNFEFNVQWAGKNQELWRFRRNVQYI